MIPPVRMYALDDVTPCLSSSAAYHPAVRVPRPLELLQWKMILGMLRRAWCQRDRVWAHSSSRDSIQKRSDATWPAKVCRRCARCFVPRVDGSIHSLGEHSDKRRDSLLEGLRRDIDRARDDDRAGFLRGHVRVRPWPRFVHVLAAPLSSSATPLTSRSVRRTSTTRKSTPARSEG
jgi:hypothetical protein